MARFPTKTEAWTGRRAIVARIGIVTSIVHCDKCDQYHTIAKSDSVLGAQHYKALQLLSAGYTQGGIAKELGCTRQHVERIKRTLMQRLNALNSPHLVAIACTLGMIDPHEFVPKISERKH